MRKMDEMDRSIQMRSEAWGFKAALLALSLWTLFNVYQSIVHGQGLDMLPTIILCLIVCVHWFSQAALKRKMIAGDEEYKEPNKVLQAILMVIALLVLILFLGSYLLMRG